MGIKIDTLPPALRAQVEAKLMAEDARRLASSPVNAPRIAQDAPERGTGKETGGRAAGGTVAKKRRREPNKTEAEYNRRFLSGRGRYEAVTLRLPGGSRYTPDWVSVEDGRMTLHEVKGAYRFHSQGRALTAFREAVAAFPEFGFVWAVRRGPGDWEITRHA